MNDSVDTGDLPSPDRFAFFSLDLRCCTRCSTASIFPTGREPPVINASSVSAKMAKLWIVTNE